MKIQETLEDLVGEELLVLTRYDRGRIHVTAITNSGITTHGNFVADKSGPFQLFGNLGHNLEQMAQVIKNRILLAKSESEAYAANSRAKRALEALAKISKDIS